MPSYGAVISEAACLLSFAASLRARANRPTRVCRRVLAGTGALLVSFSLSRAGLAQQGEVQGAKEAAGPKLPGALGEQPMLDAWIRIEANGAATVFTGKAELGQASGPLCCRLPRMNSHCRPSRSLL
jgi:hypothetical protein